MRNRRTHRLITPITARAFAGLILCLAIIPAALAQTAHQQIHTAVREHIENLHTVADNNSGSRRVEIEISAIDPRLPLAVCDRPLQTALPQNQTSGRINVRVECHGSIPWAKYVPASIRVFDLVLTTTRPLSRGEVLDADDLTLAPMELSSLRQSWLQEADLAIGMELRRALPASAVVTQEALTLPTVVRRGDVIVISASAGGIAIRQQGIALQDGEMGKRIPVRNSNSERVVQAVVTGPGQAEVIF